MKHFFSVDWGTSSFRLRLVKTEQKNVKILHEVTDSMGIAIIYALWETQKTESSNRIEFYINFLAQKINEIKSVQSGDFEKIPVVISGMASSSIGIKELSYSPLPFAMDGTHLNYDLIKNISCFPHTIILVSGVCCENDVMRGEEIQLIGCYSDTNSNRNNLYIFPGTHSKHIWVKDRQAIAFKTYMTGELFHLLTTHSILKNSINKSDLINETHFKAGVKYSAACNLLGSLFSVRTNDILKRMDKSANYSFLSGLLIGYELGSLKDSDCDLFLCGHSNLSQSYLIALQELGLTDRIIHLPVETVDRSVVIGHMKLLTFILNNIAS